MNADYRRECIKKLPPKARGRIVLPELDREYTLSEIAVLTSGGPARALGLSHKGHLGIGADGIMRVTPGGVSAQVRMELLNADGSSAEMSGNGIRCLAQAVFLAGMASPPVLTVDTDAGLRTVRLESTLGPREHRMSVEMGQAKVVGQELEKSLTPGQTLVRIINDELIALMGEGVRPLNLRAQPPVVMLMCGLQGGGKTTTTGKLAKWLKETQKKAVYVASLDVYRPAAIEQLGILAGQVGAQVLESSNDDVLARAKAALKEAKAAGADVVILDTAGRLTIDEDLMAELVKVREQLVGARAVEIAIGFVMAFVAALVVVKPFLRFVARSGFVPFAWYRIAAGLALFGALAAGWLG